VRFPPFFEGQSSLGLKQDVTVFTEYGIQGEMQLALNRFWLVLLQRKAESPAVEAFLAPKIHPLEQ
jgi:hypothetical protein